MKFLDLVNPTPEERAWLARECYRRAASCFEQVELWRDAAECWAEAGDTERAAELYLKLADHALAAPLLLGAGRLVEALGSYRAWLVGLGPGDVLGEVTARLGIAACLQLGAGEQRSRGAGGLKGRGAVRRPKGEAEEQVSAARALVEEEAGREALLAGRCWEALAEYGVRVRRRDLVQVGYERALAGYGEQHPTERQRAGEAYLKAVGANRLLVAELKERLAVWQPEGQVKEWERLRAEIERVGFRGGGRDVLHFVEAETQLAAWFKLAELENEPDQAAIDAYLASLAPAGLVYIPAGAFLMGSAAADPQAEDNEKPQHEVRLGGYYLGRYPVTNEEYRAFIEAGGYDNPAYWTEALEAGRWEDGQYRDYSGTLFRHPRLWNDERFNGPRQPVVGVSWYEAVAYCRWRGLRLPTEAEWEKAAGWEPGAKQPRRYPWGDELVEANWVYRPDNWPEVGQISPGAANAYGLADMAGLYTWCSTRWSGYQYPYDPADGREDLSGGDDIIRVLRGGGGKAEYARCASRLRGYPRYWDIFSGFRVSAPRRLPPILTPDS